MVEEIILLDKVLKGESLEEKGMVEYFTYYSYMSGKILK